MDKYLTPVRHLWQEKQKHLILTAVITAIVWILLYLGFLPTYSTTPLEEKLSYFFPVWMIVGVFAYAYLHYRVENLEDPDKIKTD